MTFLFNLLKRLNKGSERWEYRDSSDVGIFM